MSIPGIAAGLHGGFNPKQLGAAVLYAWYDASQHSGSDGDAVTTMSDYSGNGRHLTQSTAGKKPTLKTGANGRNNKNVFRFDGGDTVGYSTAMLPTNVKLTMFYVVKQTTISDNTIWGNTNTGAGHFTRFRNNGGTQQLRWICGQALYDTNISVGADTWAQYTQIIRAEQGGTSGTVTFRINGSEIATSGTQTPNGGSPDGNFHLGSNIDSGSYLTGDFSEMIICSGELSTIFITQMEAYLKQKYAL